MHVLLLVLIFWAVQTQEGRAQPPDLTWHDLAGAYDSVRVHQRPLLVYVHAAWCGPCRLMEQEVFPATTTLMRRFARTRLEFDDRTTLVEVDGVVRSEAAWARHYGVDATPGFVLMEPGGSVVVRWTGATRTEAFGRLLAYVATGAYRHATLEEYVRQTSSDR